MMKLWNWLKGRLRSDFTPRQLLARIAVDLLISNLGFLMGVLTTIGIGVFKWDVTPQIFFHDMFLNVWLANVLPLSIFCLFSYTINGLYSGSTNVTYLVRFLAVSRAVGVAVLLFLLWIFFTSSLMPRSALIFSIIYIFVLVLSVRLFWTVFSRQYRIVPANEYDPQIQKIVRDLHLISRQEGWMPPESMPEQAAWPYFSTDEIMSVAAVLQSGKINQWTGSQVEIFQEEFADYCGVRHAIALANGSVALDLALLALDIGPGDEVIVTPRTFVASAACVVLRGAKPVFVDVDPDSQNITAESIRRGITPRTRAIIAVHLAGWPCDMDPILEIAKEHSLKVIEDCAQCHGAVYYSRWLGWNSADKHTASIEQDGVRLYPRLTGSMGDMAAFSFCQDKIMTTGGEGGMLLTNDDALWEKAWSYKDHGKSYAAVHQRQHPPGYRWLHESFGTNLRMTEIQAAIGRLQLQKLPQWLTARRSNASILTKEFSLVPGLRVTVPPKTVQHAYYKYYVFVRPEKLKVGWSRDRIMSALMEDGVPCFSGTCSEVYLEKAFEVKDFRPAERLPAAQELGETSLMFLVHPTMTPENMQKIVSAVKKVMAEATQ
ncbi:MAG TPA: aminotransferase class I/II-fold pyridoxal phosphate-dependent enzyme [Smithellaceae bacterium]|nr:aminotransferase class I/II-fold pyridoxal phosphate-dependent enzyme [Smithellaceae bacterium]